MFRRSALASPITSRETLGCNLDVDNMDNIKLCDVLELKENGIGGLFENEDEDEYLSNLLNNPQVNKILEDEVNRSFDSLELNKSDIKGISKELSYFLEEDEEFDDSLLLEENREDFEYLSRQDEPSSDNSFLEKFLSNKMNKITDATRKNMKSCYKSLPENIVYLSNIEAMKKDENSKCLRFGSLFKKFNDSGREQSEYFAILQFEENPLTNYCEIQIERRKNHFQRSGEVSIGFCVFNTIYDSFVGFQSHGGSIGYQSSGLVYSKNRLLPTYEKEDEVEGRTIGFKDGDVIGLGVNKKKDHLEYYYTKNGFPIYRNFCWFDSVNLIPTISILNQKANIFGNLCSGVKFKVNLDGPFKYAEKNEKGKILPLYHEHSKDIEKKRKYCDVIVICQI